MRQVAIGIALSTSLMMSLKAQRVTMPIRALYGIINVTAFVEW